MLKRFLSRSIPILAAVSLNLFINIAYADPIWIPGNEQAYADIEIVRPVFKNNLLSDPTGLAVFVTLRALSESKAALVFEIPYATTTYDNYFLGNNFGQETESSFGNMFTGIQIRTEGSRLSSEFGIRFPTASDNNIFANSTGILADFDRVDAFITDWISLKAIFSFDIGTGNGFCGRIRSGLTHFFHIGKETPSTTREAHFLYSAHLWYSLRNMNFGGGISGIKNLTPDDSEGQYGFMASYRYRFIKPGVHVRFPLTKGLDQVLNFVFGFNIQILPGW